jgi:hypothetical protein
VVISEECWWWTGAISSAGHGRFWIRAGLVVIAHRFAWAIAHPGHGVPGLVAHGCDNSLCQRPEHLHPSDPGGNRREWSARRGNPGSPLRDVRGARRRATAAREALRAGTGLAEAIDAGRPAVDVGQGTLWDEPDPADLVDPSSR